MGKLDKKKILSESDFKQHPVWTWDETREYKIPLDDKDVTELDTLFIKSDFKTKNYFLKGYLVWDDAPYAFVLLFEKDSIIFNVNSLSLNKISLEKVFKKLGSKPFKFFPLHYESDVVLKGGKKISGTLDFRTG